MIAGTRRAGRVGRSSETGASSNEKEAKPPACIICIALSRALQGAFSSPPHRGFPLAATSNRIFRTPSPISRFFTMRFRRAAHRPDSVSPIWRVGAAKKQGIFPAVTQV
jgi:hypothetical protein